MDSAAAAAASATITPVGSPVTLLPREDTPLSLPDFYEPELNAHQIPPHAEALIGPTALRHRAEILDRIIPEISARLIVFDCAIRLGFFDEEANVRAEQQLADVLWQLARANHMMRSAAFTAGEG